MTTHERDQLRRALRVYVDEAPPAPEWRDWDIERASGVPERSRLKGPMAALAAAAIVIVVIGGVGLVMRTATDSTPGGLGEEPLTWGDWYDAVPAEAVPNGLDATVLQGALGPEPEFDTSTLGDEQHLEPVLQSDDDLAWKPVINEHFGTAGGTFVIGGQVLSSAVGVVPGDANAPDLSDVHSRPGENAVCWLSIGPGMPSGGGGVSTEYSERTDSLRYGILVAFLGTPIGAPDAITFVVPPDASVVAIEFAGSKMWQQPRGGLALFVGDLFGWEHLCRRC